MAGSVALEKKKSHEYRDHYYCRHPRRGIGAELIQKYTEMAKSRIHLAVEGDLPVRPMHRPIFDQKDAGKNLLTAPWLVEKNPDDQIVLLEKSPSYRSRK